MLPSHILTSIKQSLIGMGCTLDLAPLLLSLAAVEQENVADSERVIEPLIPQGSSTLIGLNALPTLALPSIFGFRFLVQHRHQEVGDGT